MINTAIGLLGVGLQESRSSAATKPLFKHGLTGGGLVKPERSVGQKDVACGLRANTMNGAYVESVDMAVDFETLAYADVLGLYLMAAMGNCVSTAVPGKDGYYQHVITLGSEIPWLTFWGQIGASTVPSVQKAIGCKLDTLSIDFDGTAPLDVGITAAGIDAELFGEWTGETEPSCFDGYFVPVNGVLKFSANEQTPADCIVTKGNFELSNSLQSYRGANSVVAAEISESKLTSAVKMTTIPEDWTDIRKLLTGTSTGTEVTSKIVRGSALWQFTHTEDPDMSLEIEFQNVPWNCEMPEIDPEGNAAEIEFSADNIGVASKDGSPVKITLVNKTENYQLN